MIIKIIQQQVRESWLHNINEQKPQLLPIWRDVDDSIIYGALMRVVDVFKHVYRQMFDSLSNYYDINKIIFVKHMIQYQVPLS